MILVNKVRLFSLLLSVIALLVSCTFSSSRKKKDILQKTDAMIDREIDFGNDSVMHKNTIKIITLIADTGDCTTCSMQVYDWYLRKLDLNNKALKCDIVYILNDSVRLSADIQKLMGYYNLYYTTYLQYFTVNNKEIASSMFKTFLVGKDNRIKLVGSPLDNEKLWKLYKKIIQEELVD